MATVTVSFRASPELLTELDALAKREGKGRATLLAEMVRAGVEAKCRQDEPEGRAEGAAPLLGEIREIKDLLSTQRKKMRRETAEILDAIEKVGPRLSEAIQEEKQKAAEMVADELGILRAQLQVALSCLAVIARPDLDKKEIIERVRESFLRK